MAPCISQPFKVRISLVAEIYGCTFGQFPLEVTLEATLEAS